MMFFNNYNDLKELEDSFLGILDYYPEIEKINEIKIQMKASFRRSLLLLIIKNGDDKK